ncbi:MAG: putative serine/threonine-protein kinase Nek1 [Streblomastix strix]|uniref:non-specific serine/threonine protein kinase n=1 Tax=Streblomastix strix TaxID=222440 RepID=A0A5J4WIL6_9EUKA|nr:MAG: putative serine/threonine-protein kinase Nek1 [Streblomastix strix]
MHLSSETQRKAASSVIELLQKIKSPYLINIIETFQNENEFNVITEFCSQGSLQKYIDEQKEKNINIQQQEIDSLIISISESVEFLHKQKIFHRNLKPTNVFFSDDRKIIKLGEYGIARLFQNQSKDVDVFCNINPYTAPEALEGKMCNDKSDLYSLGVIIYQIVEGKLPFYSESKEQLAQIV